jgi:cytochrome c-type biogenesis protein CcmH/NrfG
MSMTLLGGILLVASIPILALLTFPLRSSGPRRAQLDLQICKARLEDIEARLKLGKLDEAEADAERLALLSRLRSSRWAFGEDRRRAAPRLIVPAAVFLLVAGIGAATSRLGDSEAAASGDTISDSLQGSGPDGEMLGRLADYSRSIGTEEAASDRQLPDVSTMIERLAARLETTPEDIKGWRMLGWSYFNTGLYQQAAAAYAKAVELDPSSGALKRSYEEAKAKAYESDNSETGPSSQTDAVAKATPITSEAMPPRESDAAIRSMVDGLANRLESSPRDVEGWTGLMRSRIVLGEREVAAAALRKALEVFKDDATAMDKIKAAAIELGLEAQ